MAPSLIIFADELLVPEVAGSVWKRQNESPLFDVPLWQWGLGDGETPRWSPPLPPPPVSRKAAINSRKTPAVSRMGCRCTYRSVAATVYDGERDTSVSWLAWRGLWQ